MSKGKIAAIAVSAAVIIGGAGVAVTLARRGTMASLPEASSDSLIETIAYINDTPQTEPETIPEEVSGEENGEVVDASNPNGAKKQGSQKQGVGEKVTKVISTVVATTKRVKTTGKAGIDAQNLLEEKQVAGYRYNAAGDFYYTDDKDCWQKNAGYSQIYDKCAPLAAMYIDRVRIRFNYGGQDYMVQLWKGQYGWLFVGAEIGLYTAPSGTYDASDIGKVEHYNCADKDNWLNMQLDAYWAQNNDGHYKKIFTRPYGKYWWPTGFVKGQLTKYSAPRTELKTKNRITFKSTEMANLFTEGLRKSGFVQAGSASGLVDDSYYQNGADVYVLWSSINNECFTGYGG